MKHALTMTAAAALAAGLTLGASAASAAVVCNQEGACWHTHARYEYRPEYGVTVHPDRWHWKHHEHYAWKEHEGRGYWRHGEWVTF